MPFQVGHKFSPGGKIGNKGGRPTREQAEAKKTGAQIARQIIEENAARIAKRYVERALGDDGGERLLQDAMAILVAKARQEIDVQLGVRMTRADDELASNINWRKAKDVTPPEEIDDGEAQS